MPTSFTIADIIAAVSCGLSAWAALEAHKASKTAKEQTELSRRDMEDRKTEAQQTLIRQRKEATIEAYAHLQEQVLDPLSYITETHIKDVCDGCRTDACRDEYRQLGSFLARLEHFCAGVQSQVYDLEILNELAGGYFNTVIWKKMTPVLDAKSIGKEHSGYVHFENTCRQMTEMWKAQSGKQ